ncbi:MAG: endolytic transglycosylase MltG [Rhodoluna sp.]|nr:endolytic transglycosylase MltG [Rhodoluna sp.]
MSEPQYLSRRDLRKPRIRPLRLLSLIAVVALVLGSLAFMNRVAVRGVYEQITGAEYSGEGSTLVNVIISRGDVGTDIARKLVEADVTKNYDITLRSIYSANPTFFPGTYKLPSQIPSTKAIEYLIDPKNKMTNRITIREGLRNSSVFELLSTSTGIPVDSFVEAAQDLKTFGIPKAAPSLEGYLFPATYEFDASYTAQGILKVLVERTKEQLVVDGVAKKDWHKVLTLASVIQREARQEQDFYKVSRVFLNRMKINMPLQSDATVSYGVNGNTFQTSAADRADPNLYNTYVHTGLPIGPISGVGALALDAALNPAEGNWLYFVSVNLKTGETVFSDTFAQHEEAVRVWIRWLKENPDWND